MSLNNNFKYRPDIDGIRAIAVLMVLAVHASPASLPNGFVGVDLFFVISGYLITSILCRELSEERFSIRDFYVRRINRIFPALLVVLAFCLIIGPWVMYPSEYAPLSKSAFFSAIFVANVHFYLESGYWDVASKLKPLLHLWSLGVEEQFYLLWPLILLATIRTKRSLVAACLAVIVLSLAVNLVLTSRNQPAAFYLPFGRFWELSAGGLLACIQWTRNSVFGASRPAVEVGWHLRNSAGWLGLGLLLATQCFPINPGKFPGFYAIVVVLGAVLILLAGPDAWINRKVLSNPAMVYVGKLSYPLYLWHWPLLVFGRLLGDGHLSSSHRNIAVLASVVLAALTYHGVERQLISHISRKRVLATVLGVLMTLTGLLAYLGQNGILTPSAASHINSPLENYEKPQIISRGKIHLLGDSNAGHFHYGLSLLYGDRVEVTAVPGWPYLEGVKYRDDFIPHYEHKGSPDLTERALQYIESDAETRLVILSTAYLMYFPSDNLRSVESAVPGETSAQAYEKGLRRTIKRLLAKDKRVLLVKSIPTYPMLSTVMACSSEVRPPWRLRPANCERSRELVESERREYDTMVARVIHGLEGVTVFDTLNDLCDSQSCYVNRNGVQMYIDSGHFTTAGSQIMGAALGRLAEEILTK
ncbi:acyltransferase family protein [Acidovorax radicis]|uniref:acyltransferase family protein n=1 Tax=Acidovorax radicis TaxID=758826 RepID=UPI000304E73C|nr:acyltransferase family protein [Acidovorax radicis]